MRHVAFARLHSYEVGRRISETLPRHSNLPRFGGISQYLGTQASPKHLAVRNYDLKPLLLRRALVLAVTCKEITLRLLVVSGRWLPPSDRMPSTCLPLNRRKTERHYRCDARNTRSVIIKGYVIATGVEDVGLLACLYAPTGSHESGGRMPLQVQRSRLSMTRDVIRIA
jgi:hypothetical protein